MFQIITSKLTHREQQKMRALSAENATLKYQLAEANAKLDYVAIMTGNDDVLTEGNTDEQTV